jgi:hypothetical protein
MPKLLLLKLPSWKRNGEEGPTGSAVIIHAGWSYAPQKSSGVQMAAALAVQGTVLPWSN